MKRLLLLAVLAIVVLVVLASGYATVQIEGRTRDAVLVTVTARYWSLEPRAEVIEKQALYLSLSGLMVQQIYQDKTSFTRVIAKNSPLLIVGVGVTIPRETLEQLAKISGRY